MANINLSTFVASDVRVKVRFWFWQKMFGKTITHKNSFITFNLVPIFQKSSMCCRDHKGEEEPGKFNVLQGSQRRRRTW